MDWKSIQYHYAKRSNYFCPLRQKHYPTVQRSNMSSIVWSWFFFFRVTSLQMMYIRDVYLHLILWGTRWPNSRYEHSILEWLQKKGFRPKAPQIDVSKGIVKVNSVQEACTKCFGVHILEFEILQVTWKKWNKEHQKKVGSFPPIDLAFLCFFVLFFSCDLQDFKF